MMMQRRHLKNAPARLAAAFCQFEDRYLQHHRHRFENKNAADERQQKFLLRQDRHRPKAPPIASEPTSPINTSAGGELYHRNPRLAPTIAPQKTVSSAAAGLCVMSRSLRPSRVAREIRQRRQSRHCDECHADRQPVESVREIYRV